MRDDIEFKGYWSDKEQRLWKETDWAARDYNDLPVEEDTFNSFANIYGLGKKVIKKPMTFVKYIRSNPIYPPYYGPIYDSALKEYMKENSLLTAMYDGNMVDAYQIHDRFETSELYNMLSN